MRNGYVVVDLVDRTIGENGKVAETSQCSSQSSDTSSRDAYAIKYNKNKMHCDPLAKANVANWEVVKRDMT